MLFYEILSGHRLNVVDLACTGCGFFDDDHCGNLYMFISVVWALFLSSILCKLEKGKHYLGVEYCSQCFCSLSFSSSEKVSKDCITLYGLEFNKFPLCVYSDRRTI